MQVVGDQAGPDHAGHDTLGLTMAILTDQLKHQLQDRFAEQLSGTAFTQPRAVNRRVLESLAASGAFEQARPWAHTWPKLLGDLGL